MTCRYLLPIALLLLVPAFPAAADERAPAIAPGDLPVAGTCAPLRTDDVTHVTVGLRTEVRWFQVSGLAAPVEYLRLVEILQQRAGPTRPSGHAVWINASANHAWIHANRVRQACAQAGIYRVGLRVRSEATGQVLGFPLFLPAGPGAKPAPRSAGRLKVRIVTVGEKQTKAASDPGHVYAAALRAQQKRAEFGVERIVANLWIATNTPLQYAVTALDLLYRGGCVGVELRSGVRVPQLKYRGIPKIEIQGGVVSRHPQALKPAPLAPRGTPWPLDGAAEAGWVDFEVKDLPAVHGGAKPEPAKPSLRPNYAAQGQGVPAEMRRTVETEALAWARKMGADMLAGLRGGPELDGRFSIALRRKEVLPKLIAPVRAAFPDATRVVFSTLQFRVFFFNEGKIQARADATLNLAGTRPALIFGRWMRLDASANITLAPFAVDPFAGGNGSAFRVWFESVFFDASRSGVAGLPLAAEQEVLAQLPAVAHPGTRGALQGRGADIRTLADSLARTAYDRLVVLPQRGTAAVHGRAGIVGILAAKLRAEEQDLRLTELKPRRAPR